MTSRPPRKQLSKIRPGTWQTTSWCWLGGFLWLWGLGFGVNFRFLGVFSQSVRWISDFSVNGLTYFTKQTRKALTCCHYTSPPIYIWKSNESIKIEPYMSTFNTVKKNAIVFLCISHNGKRLLILSSRDLCTNPSFLATLDAIQNGEFPAIFSPP